MTAKINAIFGFIILAVAAYIGYALLQSRVTTAVYRDRLVELADDYEALRQHYNEAVRRTAVTELVVENGGVCVRVRNAAGVVETIATPFDASREIYVDYVVIDGRLWIRRVFDDRTPPSEAVVVDPKLVEVDWDDAKAVHGKAAYRRLSDGVWIVTVTGDGALGLSRIEVDPLAIPGAGVASELVHAPLMKKHEPIEESVRRELDGVSVMDVLKQAAP